MLVLFFSDLLALICQEHNSHILFLEKSYFIYSFCNVKALVLVLILTSTSPSIY